MKARIRRGEPLDGEYARAAEFVKKYQQYAFRLQNRDGSLSTDWFRGRGDDDDINRRIKTTGHILEWLCYSLSDEELRDQRTIRAVTYLANLMYSNYDNEWEVGPLSHATHALLLYDRARVPAVRQRGRPWPCIAAGAPKWRSRISGTRRSASPAAVPLSVHVSRSQCESGCPQTRYSWRWRTSRLAVSH